MDYTRCYLVTLEGSGDWSGEILLHVPHFPFSNLGKGLSADTHLPSSSEISNTGLKALGKVSPYVLWCLVLKADSGLNKLHTKMQNGNNQPEKRLPTACAADPSDTGEPARE